MAHRCDGNIVQYGFYKRALAMKIIACSSVGFVCAGLVSVGLIGLSVSSVQAQSSSGVMVNLDVLDDLDPMKTRPRLLMPSSQSVSGTPARGRIVLTPPAGVNAISPQRSRITLRPPPGTPSRVAAAPRISVPKPAAAAAAPPVSVTRAPPAPAPEVAVAQAPGPSRTTIPAAPLADLAPAAPVAPEAPPAPSTPSVPQQSGALVGPVAEPPPLPGATTEATPPEETQTASLPPAETEDQSISITFGIDETDLPSSATADLTDLSDRLKAEEGLRVQLLAYASSADGSASSVRRKSLSRALSVREFLMDQGVQSTRIEVRALGDQNEGGNPNRVDAILDQR